MKCGICGLDHESGHTTTKNICVTTLQAALAAMTRRAEYAERATRDFYDMLAAMTAERDALAEQFKAARESRKRLVNLMNKYVSKRRHVAEIPWPPPWLDQALNEGDGVYRP